MESIVIGRLLLLFMPILKPTELELSYHITSSVIPFSSIFY